MSDTLRPYFWIRRNGETYVPLIPVDELPSWLDLKGIAPTKNWEEVSQGEMRFLGDHFDHDGNRYAVNVVNTRESVNDQGGGFDSDSSLDTHIKKAKKTGGASSGVDQVQANIDKITSGQEDVPEGSQDGTQTQEAGPKYTGTAGTLGKKVYCTYWIRTGNCNYMQEGCKYKHEIPPDDETRLAIGVRTYPTWPREDPVTNPRPPAIKVLPGQNPALLQPSWRRQESQHRQAEPAGAQKPMNRDNPPTFFSGPNHHFPGPITSASAPSPHQPVPNGLPLQQKVTNISPNFSHLPNHKTQQHSAVHTRTPTISNVNRPYQAPTPTGIGHYNGQSTPVAVQPPPNRVSSMTANSHQPSPRVHASVNQQGTAQPQAKVNPFLQRVASNVQAISNEQVHGLFHPSGRLSYQIVQKPQPQNIRPIAGSAIGATSFPNLAQASADATRSSAPPPYMPAFISPKGSPNATGSTSAGASNLASAQFDGSTVDQHTRQSSAQLSSGLNENSNAMEGTSQTGQASMPTTHNGVYTDSSTSRINTPVSSNDNARAIFHSKGASHQNQATFTASSTRSDTPTATNERPAGKLNGNALSFFSTNDPAIIAAQPQSSVSIKGRGPVLFNENAHTKPTGTSATSDDVNQQQSQFSPPPYHRRMFREPGEAEFVANPLEEAHGKSQRTTKKVINGNVHGKGKPYLGKNPHPAKKRGHGSSIASSRTHAEDLLT